MSSSAAEGGFGRFLERSLDLLAAERPDAYAALCRVAVGRSVAFTVDGDTVWVAFELRRLRVEVAHRRADVEVVTSGVAILSVIDGAATIASLAIDEHLELQGHVDDVLAFHDALSVYVHGAVRAPSFSSLLREFRAAVVADAGGMPVAAPAPTPSPLKEIFHV